MYSVRSDSKNRPNISYGFIRYGVSTRLLPLRYIFIRSSFSEHIFLESDYHRKSKVEKDEVKPLYSVFLHINILFLEVQTMYLYTVCGRMTLMCSCTCIYICNVFSVHLKDM